jgi:hypothetical protein
MSFEYFILYLCTMQDNSYVTLTVVDIPREAKYIGRTESHEQLLFACNLGTADEREYGGRWNQLLR